MVFYFFFFHAGRSNIISSRVNVRRLRVYYFSDFFFFVFLRTRSIGRLTFIRTNVTPELKCSGYDNRRLNPEKTDKLSVNHFNISSDVKKKMYINRQTNVRLLFRYFLRCPRSVYEIIKIAINYQWNWCGIIHLPLRVLLPHVKIKLEFVRSVWMKFALIRPPPPPKKKNLCTSS